jgi:hypothetical protein
MWIYDLNFGNDTANAMELNQFYASESQYYTESSFGTGGINSADTAI